MYIKRWGRAAVFISLLFSCAGIATNIIKVLDGVAPEKNIFWVVAASMCVGVQMFVLLAIPTDD